MSDIKDIQDVIHDQCGLVLTDAQAQEVLDDPRLGHEITQWGANDTCTRESIGDFFAKKIVGQPWPTYREGHDVFDTFLIAFREKAPTLGYKVVE